MLPTLAAKYRVPIVAEPGRVRGYDAIVSDLHAQAPAESLTAARRSCVIEPSDRRLQKNLILLLAGAGRWDELQRKVPRRPQPLPPRRHFPVDLDAALVRYGRLMQQAGQREAEGWAPSRIEHWKRAVAPTREHLARFRRSEISSGTQNAPDRPRNFPSGDLSRLYPDLTDEERGNFSLALRRVYLGMLRRLYRNEVPGIDLYDAAVIDDDRFGARTLDVPDIGTVTETSVRSAYYACRLVSLVPENGVVLEIGGGFGAVASRLMAIRPDITYVLTDLPVNMVLTHTYLTSLFGDAVVGLWEDGAGHAPHHRALIVPPWRLRSLPLRVDLAVNTMSFQHMDARNHAFYGEVMRTLGVRHLYHVNRNAHLPGTDTMDIPAERYSFMADYDVVESIDLDVHWIEVLATARA